jgi:flagellar basal-body rod protein FlgC
MNLISGIELSASALAAQKVRLDIVAQNIANAQTTRTASGGPYQRRVVSFETELVRSQGTAAGTLQSVRVGQITTDRSSGQQVYNPQHPDASPDGLVTMPNVNLSQEMVDLIMASRTYEANLSVVRNARQMATRTLDIGK